MHYKIINHVSTVCTQNNIANSFKFQDLSEGLGLNDEG